MTNKAILEKVREFLITGRAGDAIVFVKEVNDWPLARAMTWYEGFAAGYYTERKK